MLINHPTDGATGSLCCLTLITRRRYVTMHCLSWNGGHMYFHRTVRDHTATVWRRCSVDVVVDRWRCRPDVEGVRLLGRYYY